MKTVFLSSCTLLLLAVGDAQVVNPCYNVPDGRFVPDLNDCNSYYTCYKNVGYFNTCPNGFVFSSEKQSCDYPSNVNCISCEGMPDLTFMAVPSVCSKYVICAGGNPFMQSCVGGLEFNSAESKCDFASNANCPSPPAACPASTAETLTFLDGGGDCTKYTICYKGTGFSQTCAVGTLFNVAQGACVPSTQFTCPTASTTAARSLPPLGAARPGQFQMKNRRDPRCPASGTKFIPHSSDCSRYYFCVDGQSASLSCAQGLNFDEKSQTCRLPKDAPCSI